MAEKVVSHDTSDPAQVKAKQRKAQIEDGENLAALRSVLATYQGRLTIWRVLSESKYFIHGFNGDANLTFFNEGRRAVGGWLLQQLFTADPKAYTLMREEAEERDNRNGKN